MTVTSMLPESALLDSVDHLSPVRRRTARDEGSALDVIFIEAFTGQTIIGIDDCEQDIAQPVVIDVHAGLPRIAACISDRIDDTINYAGIHARLESLLREHDVKLLEALAGAIARIVIGEFGAEWVKVRVAKPFKFVNVSRVGVEIERTRQDFDSQDADRRGRDGATVPPQAVIADVTT